jgi:hypothetical protein
LKLIEHVLLERSPILSKNEDMKPGLAAGYFLISPEERFSPTSPPGVKLAETLVVGQLAGIKNI